MLVVGASWACTVDLANSDAARITVLDVMGRVVALQEIAGLGAGRHTVDFRGPASKPGVYLLRLDQAGQYAITKVVRAN